MQVVGTAESSARRRSSLPKRDYDVILMDIEMERRRRIHAAENILSENPDAIVIFLTALKRRT